MRREIVVNFGKATATVREIRPVDLKRAITRLTMDDDRAMSEITAEEWDSALLNSSDLISIDGECDLAVVRQYFSTINYSFFKPNSGLVGRGAAGSLLQSEKNLNSLCIFLTHKGHGDCWHYGWSYFLAVQKWYEESR